MQKLDFNKDGKLVAFTDNGCTDGKSATTELKGTFEVSADVVKFILAKEYELPAVIRAEMKKEILLGCKFHHLFCTIGDEEKERLLNEYKTEMKRLCEEKKELEKENLAFKNAIDDFNRTRRFYERKIKIETNRNV